MVTPSDVCILLLSLVLKTILLTVLVNTLCASHLCPQEYFVNLQPCFVVLEFSVWFYYTLFLDFSPFYQRDLICEIVADLMSQGYKLLHYCLLFQSLFVFPVGSGLSSSYLDVSNLFPTSPRVCA